MPSAQATLAVTRQGGGEDRHGLFAMGRGSSLEFRDYRNSPECAVRLRGRIKEPKVEKGMRWAEEPRIPLAEPPSGEAQGCCAKARTPAIFSTEFGAEQWVRGSEMGDVLLILSLLASGDC